MDRRLTWPDRICYAIVFALLTAALLFVDVRSWQ